MTAPVTNTKPPAESARWFHFSRKARRTDLIILLFVGIIALYIAYLTQNRAADVVSPIGKELVSNGAVFKCKSGDPGHGPDTSAAYYGEYYDLHMSKDEAIALVTRVAKDNGYNLTHASPGNRGHLGAVADIYIDQWYFDDTSKQNPYPDIKPGPIELSVGVDAPGSKNSCTPTKTVEPGHVGVGVEVQLPEYRHL